VADKQNDDGYQHYKVAERRLPVFHREKVGVDAVLGAVSCEG